MNRRNFIGGVLGFLGFAGLPDLASAAPKRRRFEDYLDDAGQLRFTCDTLYFDAFANAQGRICRNHRITTIAIDRSADGRWYGSIWFGPKPSGLRDRESCEILPAERLYGVIDVDRLLAELGCEVLVPSPIDRLNQGELLTLPAGWTATQFAPIRNAP